MKHILVAFEYDDIYTLLLTATGLVSNGHMDKRQHRGWLVDWDLMAHLSQIMSYRASKLIDYRRDIT